jgi:hypothetical protein
MRSFFPVFLIFICCFSKVFSQIDSTSKDSSELRLLDKELVEKLKYKQQPGLALAASKIFFSDKRYSISGFGEFNFVHYLGDKDNTVGDIELYYTNLYRFATFFGYRIKKNLIWNSEFQIEYLHDGTKEGHHEIVVEAFIDYLKKDYFNVRLGFLPLPIGFVNNNDEPIMFYSVNRSEVERLIIPSTWIELGAMVYGGITENINYAVGISQGLKSDRYVSGTWIRQGREISLDFNNRISLTPQLIYTGIKNLTLSTSAYIGNSGQNRTIIRNNQKMEIKAPVNLYTGYIKYNYKNFRFTSVGTYGQLGETDKIYDLTAQISSASPQVMGKETYGYLFELGIDMLHYFKKETEKTHKHNFFYDNKETKLPLFVRYERLNTHYKIDESLVGLPYNQNDLDIWTLGINFNTKENVVLKANYQFRNNRFKNPNIGKEGNLLEFGLGFIF